MRDRARVALTCGLKPARIFTPMRAGKPARIFRNRQTVAASVPVMSTNKGLYACQLALYSGVQNALQRVIAPGLKAARPCPARISGGILP